MLKVNSQMLFPTSTPENAKCSRFWPCRYGLFRCLQSREVLWALKGSVSVPAELACFAEGRRSWYFYVSLPEWRNGRRGGLKIRCPQGRVGSTPSSGTRSKLSVQFTPVS